MVRNRLLPIATLSVCLFAGMPASAATAIGNLAFSNGTDDFFSEVTPGVGDTFDIEFNPFSLNFVTTQDGVFTPPFDGSPVQGVASSIGAFEFVSSGATSFIYSLTSDLAFNYDNGVAVTLEAGTQFEGAFSGASSVEFGLATDQLFVVSGLSEEVVSLSNIFQFSDTDSLGGGTYNARVSVSPEVIPLPASGPLALLGLGGLFFARRFRS